MKSPVLILAAAALAGCASGNRLAVAESPAANPPEAIRAFADICLKTAPSFSRAATVAASFGVNDFTSLGTGKLGMKGDQSLGVQIKEGDECVVTTPSQPGRGLTRMFQQSVARAAHASPASRVPFQADIGGTRFIFLHDRVGGEAYVMLKAGK